MDPADQHYATQEVVYAEVGQGVLDNALSGMNGCLLTYGQTGSGKTLAYVLPMLHQLKTMENEGSAVSAGGRPRGLVLVPARELGEQVTEGRHAALADDRDQVARSPWKPHGGELSQRRHLVERLRPHGAPT